MDTQLPLTILETALLRMTVKERKHLLRHAGKYVHDKTFVAQLWHIQPEDERNVRIMCAMLHGFNSQPGLLLDINRWIAEAPNLVT